MAVVTISRQLGSHGARIARSLAKELHYSFADKDLVDRVVRQYGLTGLNALYDQQPSIWDLFDADATTTIRMLNETIAAIAHRGDAVILGRGGFSLLAGYSDALNVLIKAPLDLRIARIAERDQTTTERAAEKVERDDAKRAKFVRLFYGSDWAKESEFDLVIDTEATTDAEARAQVVAALQARLAAGGAGPSVASLEVDPVLAEAVAAAMG